MDETARLFVETSEGRAVRALGLACTWTRLLESVLEEEQTLYLHLGLGQPIHAIDNMFPVLYKPIYWREVLHSSPETFHPRSIHDENMVAAKRMERACELSAKHYHNIRERVDFLFWLKSLEPTWDQSLLGHAMQ
jgi:hypothetical protein